MAGHCEHRNAYLVVGNKTTKFFPSFTINHTATPMFEALQCGTSRKVAVWTLDDVTGKFHWHKPSGSTMALCLTQP
jgi:hypothetical protein